MIEIVEGTKVIARGLIKVSEGYPKLVSVRSVTVVGYPEITKEPVVDKISYLAIQNEVVDAISKTDFSINKYAVEYWLVTGTGYVDFDNNFLIDTITKKKCIKRTIDKRKTYYLKHKGIFCDCDISGFYPFMSRMTELSSQRNEMLDVHMAQAIIERNKMFTDHFAKVLSGCELKGISDKPVVAVDSILSSKHEGYSPNILDWVAKSNYDPQFCKTLSPEEIPDGFNGGLTKEDLNEFKLPLAGEDGILNTVPAYHKVGGFNKDEIVVFSATTSPDLSRLGEE